MTLFKRWWIKLFYSRVGRKEGSRIVRTARAACHYTPYEWAQIKAAQPRDLKRLAREMERNKSAIRQAWYKAQREMKKVAT
jgi:hypothetical protein